MDRNSTDELIPLLRKGVSIDFYFPIIKFEKEIATQSHARRIVYLVMEATRFWRRQ
jgi:hypothetical protein